MSYHIGIFGAGQLGSYLCEAAQSLGYQTTVIAGSEQDPAVALADHHIIASLSCIETAERLAEQVDFITFEVETVSAAVLMRLKELAEQKVCKVYPSPDTMLLIQDKAKQKNWLLRQEFMTPPFQVLAGHETLDNIIASVGLPFVQKATTGGFDGRGVQVISKDNLDDLWHQPSLAEVFLRERRELGVLVARSSSDESRVYPVVEQMLDPERHIMNYAFSPAVLSEESTRQAQQLAQDVVARLNGVGIFAVEIFLTRNGKLLVNEVSPRVHNVGHLSLNANATSQYEQHLRAITGLPLGSTEQPLAAAMVNVLADPDLEFRCTGGHASKQVDKQTWLHWYGKSATKPHRKLGHITSLSANHLMARKAVDSAMKRLFPSKQQTAYVEVA